MTRRKKLKLLQDELTAINIVIERNNIPVKPIIRVYLNRCQQILNNQPPLMQNMLTETAETAFNIH